jgi:hypothetical protein
LFRHAARRAVVYDDGQALRVDALASRVPSSPETTA